MEIEILSHHYIWYILIAAIGITVGILSYKSSFPPLGRAARIFLAALRTLTIVLIGIFLIEPLLNLYSREVYTPQVAVVFDVSKSMGIDEGERSRLQDAQTALNKVLSETKAELRYFDFSGKLLETGRLPQEPDPAGDATSIANALDDLNNRKDIDRYGAVILATDGRQNLGEDPLKTAEKMKLPIFTLTVGRTTSEKNLAIDNMIAPAIAYSDAQFRVDVEMAASGLPPGKSKIFLKQGSKLVAEKSFDLPQENRRVRVSFDIKAPAPGNYEYALSSPILEGESNKVDNERFFAVKTLKNKAHILLASSLLNWEYKFLKQSLGQYEEFDVAAVYPEAAGNFASPGLPQGIEALKKYDVIIILDSAPSELRISQDILKKFIQDGGSFIYLAGDRAVGNARSFGGILPLKFDSPKTADGEYFVEPSALRKQHAAVLLNDDPDESLRIWRSLPPLDAVLTGITPAGEVLLEASAGKSSQAGATPAGAKPTPATYPILTVSSMGQGKVAAITGYPWWQGYFGSARDSQNQTAIPDFWRNLVRWAMATDQIQNFKIVTDQKVYRLGEPVRLTGYLYDESNRPRNGAYVGVSISPQGEETWVKEVVLPPADNGIYSEMVSSLPPGRYDFRASATSYGDTAGKTTGGFAIESYSLEMVSSAPDYNLTRRLAEATGGVAYTSENIDRLPQDLKLEPREKENQASVKPFGMPLLLIVLLAGLCLEWALRKRFRLP